jgi:hypothetical protein
MSMIMYTKDTSGKQVLPRAGITHLFNALLNTPNMYSSEEGSRYSPPTKYPLHWDLSKRDLIIPLLQDTSYTGVDLGGI